MTLTHHGRYPYLSTSRAPKTRRQKSTATGRQLVQKAKLMFEEMGYLVETAPNVVRWIPDIKNGNIGKRIPISTRHDFFGVWDLICVGNPDAFRQRFFVQVTDQRSWNMGHRKAKILASGFPCTADDMILGYRGRSVFRVLRGPRFSEECPDMRVPPKSKK